MALAVSLDDGDDAVADRGDLRGASFFITLVAVSYGDAGDRRAVAQARDDVLVARRRSSTVPSKPPPIIGTPASSRYR